MQGLETGRDPDGRRRRRSLAGRVRRRPPALWPTRDHHAFTKQPPDDLELVSWPVR
jgi:hypothetical protein